MRRCSTTLASYCAGAVVESSRRSACHHSGASWVGVEAARRHAGACPAGWAGSCMGTEVELWQTWAWLWPRRCPRQAPCRAIAVVPGKDLAGGLVDFLGTDLAEDRRLLVLIRSCVLMIFTKICMPPWRCLPSLGSNVVDGVGTLGLKSGAPCRRWASCPGKTLVGAVEAAPARVLPRESTSPSCSLCFFVLALLCPSRAFGRSAFWCSCFSAPSPCPAKCGRRRGSDCPCTSRWVKKESPYFCTPTAFFHINHGTDSA